MLPLGRLITKRIKRAKLNFVLTYLQTKTHTFKKKGTSLYQEQTQHVYSSCKQYLNQHELKEIELKYVKATEFNFVLTVYS